MVANTLSPFAAMIPSSAYAEDIAAPVEVVEEKEPAEELGIESEAVDTGDAEMDRSYEEEISGDEITNKTQWEAKRKIVMKFGRWLIPNPDIFKDGL